MTELVNFELAKLLKEKGFDIPQLYFYIDGDISWKVDNTRCRNQIEGEYAAPTIAEIVMWLYEKHKIWIVAFPELFNGTEVRFYPSIFEQGVGEDIEQYFNSPTEAYFAAIDYTLKNLI